MASLDELKRAAVEAAVKEVRDGMRLGLGTGSTVHFALEAIAAKIRQGTRLSGVPTSERTRREAERLGIPLTDLQATPHLDLTIDGADEIDPRLHLIKGGGGALLREKVVAAASKRVLIVADAAKMVDRLGSTFPVPVEVVPFAKETARRAIAGLGATVARRENAGTPFVTDNGNWILDARFAGIDDPGSMERRIKAIPGVAEVGIFCGLAHRAYIASEEGVRVVDAPGLSRPPRRLSGKP